jgi:hypothetical protein
MVHSAGEVCVQLQLAAVQWVGAGRPAVEHVRDCAKGRWRVAGVTPDTLWTAATNCWAGGIPCRLTGLVFCRATTYPYPRAAGHARRSAIAMHVPSTVSSVTARTGSSSHRSLVDAWDATCFRQREAERVHATMIG